MSDQPKIEIQEDIKDLVRQEAHKIISADIAVKDEEKQLSAFFAGKYGIPQEQVGGVMVETCFPNQNATAAQLMMFMAVCKQYTLNPFIKEIYAYPAKGGGITPIVSVDGWSTLINRHKLYRGKKFEYSPDMVEDTISNVNMRHKPAHAWIECTILVEGFDGKTREEKFREYFDEVYKPATKYAGPWQSHTKRMHRHKALIQAARAALGFSGIYDQDEAERIKTAENPVKPDNGHTEMWKDDEAEPKKYNNPKDFAADHLGTFEPDQDPAIDDVYVDEDADFQDEEIPS